MNWVHSFRWRILLGAFLWTFGLVPLVHLIFSTVHHQDPGRVVIARVDPTLTLMFSFFCMVAGIWQVRTGLSSLSRLRKQLSGVRDGTGRRVEGSYPIEVQPLVNDLNSLLEHRERTVRRALAKAGDLAHGLKTPLAVLAQEADRADAAGQHEMAGTISLQVEKMRRQIEFHLAHVRAAGSGDVPGARCPVLPSVEGLTRTDSTLLATLQFRWMCHPHISFAVSRKIWKRCWAILSKMRVNGRSPASKSSPCRKTVRLLSPWMMMDLVCLPRCAK